VNTYHAIKGKSRNHVLLATAIVEVRNMTGQYIPCTALLDSGSQSHFITERCLRLQLPKTQTHTSIQGISNVNTATHHCVSLHLRSRHTNWHTSLDCAIVSNITGMTPAMKLDINSCKIPKDITIADEKFNEPGSIDLLLGADLFYEMSRPGRYTYPGHFPVIQETVLGWTLVGRTPVTTNLNNTTLEEAKCAFLQETRKLDYIINHFWNVNPADQPTMTGRQKAGEEHIHTHNPSKERRCVNRRPIKRDPTHLRKSRLSAERRSSKTDIKLGRGLKRKAQDHNLRKNCKETRPKNSVRFQDGNKKHHGLPHHPTSMETGSTKRNSQTTMSNNTQRLLMC
jgi:hypothetical protein